MRAQKAIKATAEEIEIRAAKAAIEKIGPQLMQLAAEYAALSDPEALHILTGTTQAAFEQTKDSNDPREYLRVLYNETNQLPDGVREDIARIARIGFNAAMAGDKDIDHYKFRLGSNPLEPERVKPSANPAVSRRQALGLGASAAASAALSGVLFTRSKTPEAIVAQQELADRKPALEPRIKAGEALDDNIFRPGDGLDEKKPAMREARLKRLLAIKDFPPETRDVIRGYSAAAEKLASLEATAGRDDWKISIATLAAVSALLSGAFSAIHAYSAIHDGAEIKADAEREIKRGGMAKALMTQLIETFPPQMEKAPEGRRSL